MMKKDTAYVINKTFQLVFIKEGDEPMTES